MFAFSLFVFQLFLILFAGLKMIKSVLNDEFGRRKKLKVSQYR